MSTYMSSLSEIDDLSIISVEIFLDSVDAMLDTHFECLLMGLYIESFYTPVTQFYRFYGSQFLTTVCMNRVRKI